MSENRRVALPLLPTGVPGFDTVLGGGLPEFSFNLISGTPGAGKTTLAHQIMFANASVERPSLYFTVMGEPPIKMLRYQQQMDFFDAAKVGTSVHFVDLSALALDSGLSVVLERIIQQVEALNPRIVVVDSFQAFERAATAADTGPINMQSFTQRLAVQLTIWQATTFLIGEYVDNTPENNPVQTVADGIFVVSQNPERNSVVRKLQVVKSRGQDTMPGLHTVRITRAGLDALVGGGIPMGDAILVSGPSGSGKSVMATQFIAAGFRAGEPGVIAMFEEHPKEYVRRAQQLGIDLESMQQQGKVEVIYVRPLDLSPDETLAAIHEAVERVGAKRVVIDSISGFELALAPTYREDFRESLYRLVGALTGKGITVLVTMEIVQSYTDLRFSPYVISFLADDLILLRYVELAGQMRKSLVVVKMRNSDHSKDLWLYEITDRGLIMRESLQDYKGIGTGAAALREGIHPAVHPGLTKEELSVLRALIELGEATVAALAQRSGLPEGGGLIAALDRLVRLTYALKLEVDGRTIYRALAHEMR